MFTVESRTVPGFFWRSCYKSPVLADTRVESSAVQLHIATAAPTWSFPMRNSYCVSAKELKPTADAKSVDTETYFSFYPAPNPGRTAHDTVSAVNELT